MKMTVMEPGLLSTLQDGGRYGSQAAGLPVSGCMDQRAMHDANVLVNNPVDEAVIEMLFVGGRFCFDCTTYIALTGAPMGARLNEREIPLYRAVKVKPGDELRLGTASCGRYGYLAVAGGFDVEKVSGSKSTCLKCGLGGFRGRALQAGDELELLRETSWLLDEYRKCASPGVYLPGSYRQSAAVQPGQTGPCVTVRAVPGPQDSHFTEAGLRTFFSEEYRVTEQSDRMGFRLDGPAVEAKGPVDILSDGIAFGSVQVPASGKPMVLLADRQTTGGYAKIATVITPDLPGFVQCMPGTRIRFQPVDICEAQKLSHIYEKEKRHFRQKTAYCEGNLGFWKRRSLCTKSI